ncbi:MAG: exodeoxyribonuclease VII large subunit [Pseudomonadota bacterium]
MTLRPKRRTEREIYTVSRVNREARRLLEGGLPMLWVSGEISNLSVPASGHWYFTLKDADAQIRCAMFRGRNRLVRMRPQNGQQVIVRGRVSLYEPRGDFQLIAEHMTDTGEGALQRAFDDLKNKLAAEGLFAESEKQPLPTLPRHIGVITSPTGAALQDILNVLKRRFASVPVSVYPVPVQGPSAAPAIVRALARAPRDKRCDVLVVARGGGSLEDLWAFNEEAVARAVAACPLPVVSAVGHETDVTICDFAADVRAPTPSAAAELVVPDAMAILAGVVALDRRAGHALRQRLDRSAQSLDHLIARHRLQHPGRQLNAQRQHIEALGDRLTRALRSQITSRRHRCQRASLALQHQSPAKRLAQLRRRLTDGSADLNRHVKRRLIHARHRLEVAGRTLDVMGPQATLARGYAIVTGSDGRIVRRADALSSGDTLDVRLADGRAHATVTAVSKDPPRS